MGVHPTVEYEAVEYNRQGFPATIYYKKFSGEQEDDRELFNQDLQEDPVTVPDIANA